VTTALLVSNALLWVAVLCLAGLVVALLRQIGVLHERIAPAGALLGREGPRPGEPAPRLALVDWNGQALTLGGDDPESRGTLLFFVSPTCPVCKALLPTVTAVCRDEEPALRVVVASDGRREEHVDFVGAHGLDRGHYVLSTELGLAYQVGRLPYAVLIDERGVVRARGLVNSREHLESLFEARDREVASVQEFVERQAGRQRVA